MIHVGARSYDPSTGRFLSVDPILATGDNQQINGYAYAHNNPVTFTDPTGLIPLCAPDGYSLCPDQPVGPQLRIGTRDSNTLPTVVDFAHGGNGIIYANGTVVVDGYVLPAGSPPASVFLRAYEEAALAVGSKTEDPLR